jgi:hypothetical protein
MFIAGDRLAGERLVYTTSFPLTENPISEGGRWISAGAFGSWSDMRTTTGLAFGTQDTPVSPPYDDSGALLRPPPGKSWGRNQRVIGQVKIANRGSWTGFHELPILLRGHIATGVLKGYECLFPCTTSTKLEMTQWLGPLATNPGGVAGNPNSFGAHAEEPSWPGLSDNDFILAQIVGTVITMAHQPAAGGGYTSYLTYDTASDAVRFSDGMPGIFHWKNGTSNHDDYAYRSIEVATW